MIPKDLISLIKNYNPSKGAFFNYGRDINWFNGELILNWCKIPTILTNSYLFYKGVLFATADNGRVVMLKYKLGVWHEVLVLNQMLQIFEKQALKYKGCYYYMERKQTSLQIIIVKERPFNQNATTLA